VKKELRAATRGQSSWLAGQKFIWEGQVLHDEQRRDEVGLQGDQASLQVVRTPLERFGAVLCVDAFGDVEAAEGGVKRSLFADVKQATVTLHQGLTDGTERIREIELDAIFDDQHSSEELFRDTTQGLVEAALQGFHCSVFCYGQSGSGQMEAVFGNQSAENSGHWKDSQDGILQRAFQHLADLIDSSRQKVFQVRVSFVAVIQDQVFDLLASAEEVPKRKVRQNKDLEGALRDGCAAHGQWLL
ncbi:unnamed protein product, partial [Polarella glacialis]